MAPVTSAGDVDTTTRHPSAGAQMIPLDLPDIARSAIKSEVTWLAHYGHISWAQTQLVITLLGLGDA